jgi:hypothetical protein
VVRDGPPASDRNLVEASSTNDRVVFDDAGGMEVSFVAQPFADGRDLRDFLASVAADDTIDQLDVVVAWAKRSGLRRVRAHLESVRDRPGTTRLIVGIDEGGATRQGLELAREIFTTVHVFHDNTWRTFHPKIFLGVGGDRARLLVGSNNLTAGGVFYNYEAALECVLALPEDQGLVDEVRAYIDRLYADAGVCKPLDDALLEELINNPRYRVRDEDASKTAGTHSADDDDPPEDVDLEPDDPEPAPGSIFGKSAELKRADPTPAKAAGKKSAATTKAAPAKKAAPVKAAAKNAGSPGAPAAGVVKRWFKKLSASDARHPPSAASHVTGVLRLVQAGHPINQTNYFRADFFANRPWTGTPRPRGLFEETTVPFHVVVNGVAHGIRMLRVDHAPWREAGQGNHTTVLHWDDVAPILDAANYTGHYVVLERLTDGSFRLEIAPTDPGTTAFMA